MTKDEAAQQISALALTLPRPFNAPYLEAKMLLELDASFDVLPDSARGLMILTIAALQKYQIDGEVSGAIAARMVDRLRTADSTQRRNKKGK